ncbi:MAG: AAA family ATPase [Treponema sp.]|nr:AAA family ATPase [Candidatus Treponema caballi]
MDLFDAPQKNEGPLAARMRPRNLDEYIGQEHIVGSGRLLRRAIAADQLTSVIFYGPPGTGKTTLARVIANHTKSNFITLNAVLTGVQNIRDAIKLADDQKRLYERKTILFVDEVHRWNKSQQDALLPWVENGTIILVGATTENPFFEVNKALVSRSRVFQLKPLTEEDLTKAARMALTDKERGYGRWNVQFEEGALEHLIETANGDARSLLNALELAVETTPEVWKPDASPCIPPEGSTIFISKETAEESIQRKVVLYDRDGDYHYDIISAFIKSLRGRDPDAALYWMARMIAAGEDPHFIFRRMLISACEDTGLADPMALTVVESCAAAFDRIGLPEGQYMLTQAALYLATAPKSNSSMAYFDALKAVQTEDAEVPNHLRDASRDGEGFGHGAGYMYPHAYKDHWVAQQYLPGSLNGRVFYNPTTQGYEASIREDVLSRRELQITSLIEDARRSSSFAGGETTSDAIYPMGDWWEAEHLKHGDVQTPENLTFSPGDSKRAAWQKRTESHRTELLLELRDAVISGASLVRHHRSLVMGADDGLLLWEIWRRTPEGQTAGVCYTKQGYDILKQYSGTLDELDKPLLIADYDGAPEALKAGADTAGGVHVFDRVFFRDPVKCEADITTFAGTAAALFAGDVRTSAGLMTLDKDAELLAVQKIPAHSQRLSELLLPECADDPEKTKLLKVMLTAENDFYSGAAAPENAKTLFSWDAATIREAVDKTLSDTKHAVTELTERVFYEKRTLTESDINRWFAPESAYARSLTDALGEDTMKKLAALFMEAISSQEGGRMFPWKQAMALIKIR